MTEPRPTPFARLAGGLIPVESAGADRQLRLYLALVFTIFVPTAAIFAWTDYRAGSRVVAYLVAGVLAILLSSIQVLRRSKDIRRGYRLVVGATVALMAAVVYEGGGDGFAVLWFYVFPGAFYYVFSAAEATWWMAVSLALPSAVLFGNVGHDYPGAMAGRFVVTYGLVGAMAYGLQRARNALQNEVQREKADLQKALSEVRTLSGMLPMCAWCGKVRNDTGYWSRIEEYLHEHTDAMVSHGVCEDCAGKLEAEIGAKDAPKPTVPRKTPK
jgi:hypothetical protein